MVYRWYIELANGVYKKKLFITRGAPPCTVFVELFGALPNQEDSKGEYIAVLSTDISTTYRYVTC